ncbi:bifunctional diguanylate cyclase/phosphodiesterase [Nitrosovibrio sp. Nv17]|uniref:putative bifunctional diguanylate cyclase/phosphodiesterase n=1 Tax=Nitrosovibrio sp. Nv17 TaxID=1855339 RepID=UPI000908E632|nr:GGDEF domain-containing phosphodiesterase [Nitrosovibrio sp. Nv17]SFW15459.1 PAS domain S-box-containing protein/diguanylate cyclase (GGDEF) domain-containing protein [Nitrosovibrio sp. Nv17]
MRISFFSKLFTAALLLLFCVIGVIVYRAFDIHGDIDAAEQHRYRSLLLANELLQSSEELTRMVRLYALTGNPAHKRHYFEILGIREGTRPRPGHYSGTYWYLKNAAAKPAAEPKEAISLMDMMRKEGLDEQEIALMQKALENSEKLTKLEKRVIATLGELYGDRHHDSVIRHTPEMSVTIDLLFNDQYMADKTAIMVPIQEFMERLDARTRMRVAEELTRLHRQILWIMGLVLTTILILMAAMLYMRRTILKPLVQLHHYAAQLMQGDYTARCTIATRNELAELGDTLNSMASSIERDIVTRRATEESMRQATLIFGNSSEAMMVTDPDHAIISVNPAFTTITGYTREEVLGKNPDLLASGCHDESFFQAMQLSLETSGHWEGEVTSRRKNGEIYSEWRKINATHDEDGSVHRWITLFSDITMKKKSEELIWKQANFDAVTSLPNRYMFYHRLEEEIKKARRAGSSIALILLDLDHFKEINDAYGHDVGDLLLKEAAVRLGGCIRGVDTVARLGGDEFSVILGGLHNTISINRVVRNILHAMAEPFQLGDKIIYVSASVGVTFYPQDADTIGVLVSNGDQAMYAAKSQGRNCVSYYTRALHETAQARMRLASDLRDALAGDQLQLYYQPIFDLETGRIRKAEALLRWYHPDLGMINPVDFIPIAEETRMIVDIGDWVYRTALQQVKRWHTAYDPDFQVSINTSPVQYRRDVDIHKTWLKFLQELKLPGHSVVIEITEGLLMDASTAVTSKLQAFRDAGMWISMDGFGTGYSSLGYLKKFNIDYLKIDQSFVQNLTFDSSDQALCEAIIVMAHKLGIKVIAEGIESKEQCSLLAASECDYGQGNLFSRPLSVEEFEGMMRKWYGRE